MEKARPLAQMHVLSRSCFEFGPVTSVNFENVDEGGKGVKCPSDEHLSRALVLKYDFSLISEFVVQIILNYLPINVGRIAILATGLRGLPVSHRTELLVIITFVS